ncbi:protein DETOXIFICATION 56-like [Musa acuminata AAA Group]|uniref:protein DETOXIFICATION 56-like n=1 Tax=Musa acuminata AAA Group TaxID=214697 RepID=UPI0031DD0D15
MLGNGYKQQSLSVSPHMSSRFPCTKVSTYRLPTRGAKEPEPDQTTLPTHPSAMKPPPLAIEVEAPAAAVVLPSSSPRWAAGIIKRTVLSELRSQRGIALPLVAMNLTWFAKTAITTAFLGRLGELELAGGALGFTFANVTGFSVLTGLCAAMEPICGQAYGAKNYKLLRKTLLMATILLLLASLPISFLWLNVDRILLRFGQQRDIAGLARRYVTYLLPDLAVTSFLCPLKAYLSSQGVTLPTLFSSAIALAFHVPLNVALSKAKGLQGVSTAIWLTDLTVVLMLASYVVVTERGRRREDSAGGCAEEGGRRWWEQSLAEWATLLKLSAPCCLTTCLEWWCYEILVLLTGRLPDARRMVSVIAVVLNFDYLLYSVMLSLATCASTRVSNELGAGRPRAARESAYVSLVLSVLAGFTGGAAMASARGQWGRLFSHEPGVVDGVRKMMRLMALVEVVNFPLAACGGIVRGTARPWLGMYASVGGFYLVALPLAVVMGFTAQLGLGGLLLGFLVGTLASAVLLVVFVACIDWDEEAGNARRLAGKA